MFGSGGTVAPDLTGSNRANLDYVLENVLDPSAVVGKDYRMQVFVLNDGRVVSGLVEKETESALSVRTADNLVVVAKSDLIETRTTDESMMPEGTLRCTAGRAGPRSGRLLSYARAGAQQGNVGEFR